MWKISSLSFGLCVEIPELKYFANVLIYFLKKVAVHVTYHFNSYFSYPVDECWKKYTKQNLVLHHMYRSYLTVIDPFL